MPFDGSSLIPVVTDILNDFGTPGKIRKVEPGDYDGITGDPINTPEESDIIYVIEDFPSTSQISDKIESGDAKVTVQTDFEIKDSYIFIENTGIEWEIVTTTPVMLQGLNLVYELQVRK